MGEELTDDERVIFRALTEREREPVEPVRESFGIVPPMVVAGEGIRWLPRRAASSLAVPGNDFYLFDGRLIVFLLYSGDGTATERLVSSDPAEIALCRTAFESAWEQAIPHAGYRPT